MCVVVRGGLLPTATHSYVIYTPCRQEILPSSVTLRYLSGYPTVFFFFLSLILNFVSPNPILSFQSFKTSAPGIPRLTETWHTGQK